MKRILPCLIFLAAVFAAGLAVGGTTAACNGVPYQVRDSIAGCQPVPGAAPTNPNCITLRGEKPRAVGDKCNVAQSRGLTDVLYAAPPAPAIEVAHSPVPVAAAPPPVAKTIERAIPGRTTPVLSEPRTAQHRQPVADPWIILPAMLLAGLIGYVYGFAAESGDARDPRASQHATSSKVLFAVAGALVPLDFSQNLFDLTNAIDNKAVADFWQATTFFNWIFAAAWIVIVVFGVPLVLFANYLIIGAAFILALLKLRAAVFGGVLLYASYIQHVPAVTIVSSALKNDAAMELNKLATAQHLQTPAPSSPFATWRKRIQILCRKQSQENLGTDIRTFRAAIERARVQAAAQDVAKERK